MLYPHVSDEAQSLAMHRLDDRLGSTVIAQRLARRFDPAGQCRVAHDPAFPQLLEQFVPGNHAIAVFREVGNQREHLGLNGARFTVVAQLDFGHVEFDGSKGIDHGEEHKTVLSGRLENSMKSPRILQARKVQWRKNDFTGGAVRAAEESQPTNF